MSNTALIKLLESELIRIRHDLHRHPELGFEEERTGDIVAAYLKEHGLGVQRGVGGTGVVGTLQSGSSERVIALRADLDALPIPEDNKFDHRSLKDQCMHACGHDGHTTMLLGAARYLAEAGDFDGTVEFVFQPAEEGLGGAQAMLKDGLFEQHPVTAIYGMHNWPGLPAGQFATKQGPLLAGSHHLDVTVTGIGGHAAFPHTTVDPIVVLAQIVSALQNVVARSIDPLDSAVLSITKVNAGHAYNVIPAIASLSGTIRWLRVEVRKQLCSRICDIVQNISAAAGATGSCRFSPIMQPTTNSANEVIAACAAASTVVGAENVTNSVPPSMGGEDFGYLLDEVPGCFMLIGNDDSSNSAKLHSPKYDFNDNIIMLGVNYWVRLVEQELSVRKRPASSSRLHPTIRRVTSS